MGLLEETNREYYQGNDHGDYQFISLEDVIAQFQIAYVGEDKIISKIKRADIAFHAQRALQELSFDTLKSTKAHEIVLPPSLVMTLPHDYVNYTKVSTVDSAGIKHPLYPINITSNPFTVKQEENGTYSFLADEQLVKNPGFDLLEDLSESWEFTTPGSILGPWQGQEAIPTMINGVLTDIYQVIYKKDKVSIANNQLEFSSNWSANMGRLGWGRYYGAWQEIDVTGIDFVDLSAFGSSAPQINDNVAIACPPGVLRIGISSLSPQDIASADGANGNANSSTPKSVNLSSINPSSIHDNVNHLDLGYVEWNDGTSSDQELLEVNVSRYSTVYVWIQSKSEWTTYSVNSFTSELNPGYDPNKQPTTGPYQNFKAGRGFNTAPGYSVPASPNSSTFIDPSVNAMDNVKLTSSTPPNTIQGTADGRSTTQKNFNSNSVSNNQDNYIDDTYWPMDGSRYGLDPQNTQANGHFFIDNRLGKVNFSSNIAGKTVILDYISDSLGTDGEMQVHKFAEEAMYKWISHAVMAGRINIPEYQVNRFKKERFAAIRTAKLRLSNIKLEEITQIMRGRSKQIKH